MECRIAVLFICVLFVAAQTVESIDTIGTGLKILRRVYDNCEKSQEIIKCFKIQAVKLADRAARMDNLPILEGISFIKKQESAEGRAFSWSLPEGDLENLSSDKIDKLLEKATTRLFETHRVNVLPSAFNAVEAGRSMDEARGKMKKYIGPIITAIAIKGGFVAMAFKTIALIAGKALLIGKIALILSAIIGLKKLVSNGDAHEKTTYEIVKHPQVAQSHTYSSSHYGGEFDSTGPGGHYRRSVEDEALGQDRAYRAQIQGKQ